MIGFAGPFTTHLHSRLSTRPVTRHKVLRNIFSRRQREGVTDLRMDRRMDGRTDGPADGPMDGPTDGQALI